ncbi:HAD family hydrolase [Maribius pontilimi]|uniref:HAD family hydrolase n=1 Tax=Palleronia pontilimi TaxID=1964209 RepID=A0A934MAL3_9RHOB|nr:HAD family hydrolase [Palleronia pontilimi]MBJ3763757.1 HAD family hydrolase [Palleronia pontilimi]
MRIIGWSGPRNLSTAMMYAFGARPDCRVSDEPFYAAFLAATGDDHPMRDAVLASQPTDPAAVARACAADSDRPLWYQKHMCHHMLPGFPLDWAAGARHLFLIRHPARVIASYAAKRALPCLDDLGYGRQAELHARFGGPVLDSVTIRADPRAALTAACEALGIGFDPAMLRWPPGGRAEDGVWAAHWYDAVHASTGFAAPEGDLPMLDGPHADLAARAMPFYDAMLARALPVG